VVLLCFGLLLAATTAVQAKPFVFTAIPDQDESHLMKRFSGIAGYLEQHLDVEVTYVPVKSYAAAVVAFRNNQVQLAWFGGLSGVQARLAVPGSQAIAQGYEDQFFVTYFIANASTGLTASKDFPKAIAGRSFTFGSKGSTSGRLMPEFYVREAFGKAPEEVFKVVGFSGDHSRTIALVQAGTYELGALNFQVFDRELEEGKVDPNKVRVIWKTPPYPDYQWTIRGDVDEAYGSGFTDKVRKTLLELKDPQLLQVFPRKSFVPATNADYAPILATGKAIGILD
jgi:phosphonate transport system substrate-binding protein